MNASIQITIVWRDRPPEIKTPNIKVDRGFKDMRLFVTMTMSYNQIEKYQMVYVFIQYIYNE